MVKMNCYKYTSIMLLLFFLVSASAASRIDQAVETIRSLCLVGDGIDISIKGDASITLMRKGINGEIVFSKKNKKGIVEGLEGELLAKELENIRGCIEPRIDKILSLVLSENVEKNKVHKSIAKIPLPQLWEGTYTASNKSQEVRLNIEKLNQGIIFGKINWPNYYNSIAAIEGQFVSAFGDFIEETKWKIVEKEVTNTQDLSWVKFTQTAVLKGKDPGINGSFYGFVTKSGMMKGLYFPANKQSPGGKFTLFLQP